MPPTKLSPAGTSRLDALLAEHAGKNLPALFFMAATEDRVLYRACRGNVVYGKPESGEVAFRNSEYGCLRGVRGSGSGSGSGK
jgi:hypothetical protein